MSVTQTYKVPANRRIIVDVPREVPLGNVILTFTPVTANEEYAATNERIGFMKGKISVPSDFDTMGQAEIASLFGEAL